MAVRHRSSLRSLTGHSLVAGCLLVVLASGVGRALADVVAVDIHSRQTLTDPALDFSYEQVVGVVSFTLDPKVAENAAVTDIEFAPLNAQGLIEYAADFKLLIPSRDIASDTLLYNVNNRGGSRVPPEAGLDHPLSALGYTYLVTGWINDNLVCGQRQQQLPRRNHVGGWRCMRDCGDM